MKKIAVVYSSKAGHTKKYADWLKEDLEDLDVISVERFNPTQMMAYKLVIFACGVYGDKLSIMDFVKKNITAMAPQKMMVLAVSWYTNDSNEAKQKLIEENFPEQFKSSVRIFVVNSGIDKAGLSIKDKAVLKSAQAAINRKDGRSTDDLNTLGILNGYSDNTAKENLASIEKAVEEFFSPPGKAAPAAAGQPARQSPPAGRTSPAAGQAAGTAGQAAGTAQAAGQSAQSAVPKPKPASEIKTGADALSSMEDAFKALKAPKAAPAPKADPDPMKAAVASSVKDAIAALSSGAENTNFAPAPAFERNDEDTYSEAVADSIMLAQAAAAAAPQVEDTSPAPRPAPAPKVEEAAPAPKAENIAPTPRPAPAPKVEEAAPAPKAENIAPTPRPAPAPKTETPKPEPSAASKLEQLINSAVPVTPKEEPIQSAPKVEQTAPEAPEPEPVKEAPRKNSYMELFSQRRRRTAAEETSSPAPEPTPAPPPKPAENPAPAVRSAAADFDFSMDETPYEPFQTVPKAETSYGGSAEIADDFDFLSGADEAPKASSRALNAVQDLAKAKAKAEEEAAKAAVRAAEAAEEQDSRQAPDNNNSLEQMKRDMETLAEEAESGGEQSAEEDIELDGLLFTNDVDYDLESEFAEPVTETAAEKSSESRTDLDIRKLQEEINASIEQNKAAKERLEARHQKEKAVVVNPFRVQFDDEEEGKGKKKKKSEEAPPKFLEEPLDPDVFFKKPGKDYSVDTESMPEIKFRNQ